MAKSRMELLALLREVDAPERLERSLHQTAPRPASSSGARCRVEADFGASCESERDTQDSSEYGRVHVPADATVCGTRIVVCVNKFGSLARGLRRRSGGLPRHGRGPRGGALDLGDLATVERALADLGYVSIPEELLESDYECSSALEHFAARPTWVNCPFDRMLPPVYARPCTEAASVLGAPQDRRRRECA
ncbi:hypothetical protein [Streptomyces exfoliatus]|uniref:hypothetical protein n=1 Tax=Streptomyces exfoliatus TaxID=1905 RepID=UPI0037994C5C